MTSKILPAIAFLFGLIVIARIASGLSLMDAAAADRAGIATQGSTEGVFAELDSWETELLKKERDLEAQAIANEIALAEAKRHAAAAKEAEKHAEDRSLSARRLAAVYAAMAPAKAAKTLAALPAGQAAPVIAAMKPEAAGAILSAMPDDHAQSITTALMGGR